VLAKGFLLGTQFEALLQDGLYWELARHANSLAQKLQDGLIEEIKCLLAEGIPEKCTAMQAIGYKEFVDALAGRSSLEIAIAQVQQSSRRYAKRQLTWFRRNENMRWIIRKQDQDSAEILAAARQLIWNFDN
jgi:tRNA dimethylallyltransferase